MATIFRDPIETRRAVLPSGRFVDSQGSVQGSKLTTVLGGKDQFFTAPGMAPDYDWPNPRGKAFTSELRTFVHSSNFNLLPAASPFSMVDWPNPRAKSFPSDLRGFTNPAEVHLIGQDQFFAAAGESPRYDYPNPRAKPFASDLRTHVHPTNLLLYANPSPFYFTDWANPTPKRFPVDQRGHVQSSPANLFGKDQFFAAAGQAPVYDWPNPARKRIGVQSHEQSFNFPMLVAAVPFFCTDWPNPQTRRQPTENRGFIKGLAQTILSPVRCFANYEWPNPTVRILPAAFRSFTQSVNLELFGQDRMYGAPGEVPTLEFPNPRGKPNRSYLTGTLGLGCTLISPAIVMPDVNPLTFYYTEPTEY